MIYDLQRYNTHYSIIQGVHTITFVLHIELFHQDTPDFILQIATLPVSIQVSLDPIQ